MKVFLKMTAMNFKIVYHYRAGLLISIVLHPFLLVLNILLFKSIYEHSGADMIKGYSLSQMIWYFSATVFIWIFIWNFADQRMSRDIVSGDLTIHLLKPMSVLQYELAAALGLRIAGVVFEFVPDLIVYSLIFPPDFLTPFSLLKFVVSAALAFLLFFFFHFLVGLSAFYTQTNKALNTVKHMIMGFLGGSMIPLEFFPEGLRRVCEVLPARYIFYDPIQFFLNRPETASTEHWVKTLGMQLLWIAILCGLAVGLYRIAIRRYAAAGG